MKNLDVTIRQLEGEFRDAYCTTLGSLWLLSANFATAFLLLWVTLCLQIILTNAKKATFNKLTQWPYYSMMVYTLLACIEFILSYYLCDRNQKI